MKNSFETAASDPLSEAEQALRKWGAKYERMQDGTLHVPGDLDVSFENLAKLPDLTRVTVGGNFYCGGNELTSLEGAPLVVGGDVDCGHNRLISLKGAPASVGGNFYCHNNQLISLEGAPAAVGRNFHCGHNPLTALEGAPRKFKCLKSDLGNFNSWDEVPQDLRQSPESRARLEQERTAAEEKVVRDATVLQDRMRVSKPLSFRK